MGLDFRFYTLSDKVSRQNVPEAAWQAVRRNGGACGVDGETVAEVEAQGLEGWLGSWRENCERTATDRAPCGSC